MEIQVGGYDANFLTEIPDYLKCCVCQLVLKRPVHLVDCGHRLCECCFEQMKDYSQTRNTELCCPLDRIQIDNTRVFNDKGLERVVLDLKVGCENHTLGCKWIGDLRDLSDHLKVACLYMLTCCTNDGCEECITRMDFKEHLDNCPVKQITMSDLNMLKSLNQQLAQRLDECEAKLKEKDDQLKKYEKESNASRAKHEKKFKEMHNQLREIEKKYNDNRGKNENKLREMKDTSEHKFLEFERKLKEKDDLNLTYDTRLNVCNKKLQEHDKILDERNMEVMVTLRNILSESNPYFIWKITDYSLLDEEKRIYSSIFYTSLCGYKCKLSWVQGQVKGNIGLFIQFCKGANNSELKWPFSMNVTFECIGKDFHKKQTFQRKEGDNMPNWEIPPWRDMSIGIGYKTFLTIDELPVYVIDDVITIKCSFEP